MPCILHRRVKRAHNPSTGRGIPHRRRAVREAHSHQPRRSHRTLEVGTHLASHRVIRVQCGPRVERRFQLRPRRIFQRFRRPVPQAFGVHQPLTTRSIRFHNAEPRFPGPLGICPVKHPVVRSAHAQEALAGAHAQRHVEVAWVCGVAVGQIVHIAPRLQHFLQHSTLHHRRQHATERQAVEVLEQPAAEFGFPEFRKSLCHCHEGLPRTGVRCERPVKISILHGGKPTFAAWSCLKTRSNACWPRISRS